MNGDYSTVIAKRNPTLAPFKAQPKTKQKLPHRNSLSYIWLLPKKIKKPNYSILLVLINQIQFNLIGSIILVKLDCITFDFLKLNMSLIQFDFYS